MRLNSTGRKCESGQERYSLVISLTAREGRKHAAATTWCFGGYGQRHELVVVKGSELYSIFPKLNFQ